MDGRCTLETAVGRVGICPGAACPLWAQGEGCALASVEHELRERPVLAAYLLELRQELTDAGGCESLAPGAAHERGASVRRLMLADLRATTQPKSALPRITATVREATIK